MRISSDFFASFSALSFALAAFFLAAGAESSILYVILIMNLANAGCFLFFLKGASRTSPLLWLTAVLALYTVGAAIFMGGVVKAVVYWGMFFSFFISCQMVDLKYFVWRLSLMLAAFSPYLLILSLKGDVLENYPAAFLLPVIVYWLSKQRLKLLIFITVLISFGAFSYVSGARSVALAALISGGIVLIGRWSEYWAKGVLIGVLLGGVGFTFGVIYSDELYGLANEPLTYRPTLWRYYWSSLESFWGMGYDLMGFSLYAADDLSFELNRGVAEHYGPHSIFINTLFQSGFLGLCLYILLITLGVLYSDLAWLGYWGASITISTFTSIVLGAPHIYGLLAMIALVPSLYSLSKKKL